jgi:hypothetical protein
MQQQAAALKLPQLAALVLDAQLNKEEQTVPKGLLCIWIDL